MPSTLLVGSSGTGKSFVSTSIALRDLKRGRMVFANFHIQGAEVIGLEDLPHLPPSRVIIDEAASWFHSRTWSDMAKDLLPRWNQTRKDGWDLIVATQHEDNIDQTIKRNMTYGVLLAPAWKPLTVIDPRVRALARIETQQRRERLLEYQQAGYFLDLAPPTVRPSEVTHPLYVTGRRWHWANFRRLEKGRRPISRHTWLWSWKVAQAYDTKERLEFQSSKEVFRATAEGQRRSRFVEV